jgi:hypothetical protein
MKALVALLLIAGQAFAGQNRFQDVVVSGAQSIGTTSTANSKAVLDVVSTTKGMLPPRMTTTQRDAIVSPPEGLTVFNTTTHRPNRYDGTAWREIPSLDGTETLTNKTLDAALNTFTNIANSMISAGAAIARSKLASGTNYRILANDSSGVMSENAALTANGVVTADANGQLITIAPGSSGNVLTSNGTTWASSAPAASTGKATGEVFMTGAATCPSGAIEADGSSKLRTGGTGCGGGSCANLFAVYSTTWGSADGTHFNIPDIRGKFVRGYDHAAGNDPDRASRTACVTGGATGDNIGSCQTDAFQDHAHLDALDTGANLNSWGFDGSWSTVTGSSSVTSAAQHSSLASSIAGQRTSTETRPKNVSMLYCVQY